jgi:hypothetical protein
MRPKTAREALYDFYYQGIDADQRLTNMCRLLLGWLCCLASAPLPYAAEEISYAMTWPSDQIRKAAKLAAANGYLQMDDEWMTLTDPRTRPAVPK